MSQISLLLVDDHALFREGLASLLSYQPDFTVVGEAASGEEAVERARELVPDVVLMDIDLPGIDGIEATRRIKRQLPEVRVVMLTVYDDHERLFQSIKAGAQGYLIKNIRSAELLDQLRGLARGEAAISRRMAARILEEFARLERQAEILEPDGGLSPREVEVLELVALRLSNKEIAARLSISEHTVKNHLKNILAKLQLSSRRQAAAYAVAHGLIPPPKARDE
ncbi:response regulator [Sphaerobacter thermophilus]|uniref:Two component transcriptional regulator, LuxR family n=1 Tax=Sphaerobacter thermophilus (strain ATCC 49802 / DSM 20745 / KCCM 41009 / NCIMB 13125 / S 6022) TaxID=479434 RepID=D1C6S1_SPHTD|nr:response regulator transcription factor [Sphaerobacter thermophilus]ACZ37682.1 two component transcriptional regulator, LuxR family [Sphaerobacter thermophilus DSM 20745]